MRTSNKILLGFIILCFLIPTFLLLSFKNKISHGRYTVETQQGQGSNFRSGHFKPYKMIKLASPSGRMLKVILQHSDSLYYSYYQVGYGDSVRVYNEGDTLFVDYVNGKASEGMDELANLYVNLKLPSFENLIIENAEVTLDSASAAFNRDVNAEINGTGLLNIGRANTRRGGPDDESTEEFGYNLNRLSVRMNEGEVAIGSKTDIKQLNVQAEGSGVLVITDGATIGEMTGRLSEKSSVKANWKYVKKMAVLATE